MLAHVYQHGAVAWPYETKRPAAEHLTRFSYRDETFGPAQQGTETAGLRLDIDCLIAVDRIHDRWCIQAGGVATREVAVPVRCPLHRRPHTIAGAQINVVAHPDPV